MALLSDAVPSVTSSVSAVFLFTGCSKTFSLRTCIGLAVYVQGRSVWVGNCACIMHGSSVLGAGAGCITGCSGAGMDPTVIPDFQGGS